MSPRQPDPPAARVSAAWWRRRGWWDRLSLYLPVLLMGTLALVTYAVLRQTPGPVAADDGALPPGQPDYGMENFTLWRYDAGGTLLLTLQGQTLTHHPDRGSIEVRAARLERLDPERHTRTTAVAERLQTDDARSVYQLEGEVRVVRETLPAAAGKPPKKTATPRLTFEGQTLTWLTAQQLLLSDQPVRITRGADWLSGDRLRYDERTGLLELQGQVRATMIARDAAQ